MFRGKCEAELRDARAIITSQDSTIYDLRTVAGNDSSRVENCERNYRELDKRTVKKSALPWYVLAGLLVGLLVGSAK